MTDRSRQAEPMASPEGRFLLSAGVILLTASLVNGFVLHAVPLVRLALAAHLVGLLGSAFLVGLGACWPTLPLSRQMSRVAALLAVYGFGGGWLVYLCAAATGTGGMFPLASGGTRGSPALEGLTRVALVTVAAALVVLCGIVLRALCGRSNLGNQTPRASTRT